jgi:hypothetical protein
MSKLLGSETDLLKVPPRITRGMGISISSLATTKSDDDDKDSGGLEHQHTLVSLK